MLELRLFDKDFFNSLEDKEKIMLSDTNYFHTIYQDNQKVGIIGIIKYNFIQIVLKKEFRGKNLLGPLYDLIVQKYNLDKLQASIDLLNIISIKAHKKIGFTEINKEELIRLKNLKLLKPNQTRLTKTYISSVKL